MMKLPLLSKRHDKPGARRFRGSGHVVYEQTADWLYRGVMLMALFAFASLWWQIHALIGARGILPVADFLEAVHAQLGDAAFWQMPTLLWLSSSDLSLHVICASGVLACCTGLAGRARACSALLAYVAYLSLFYAGQVFTGYQWDILLIECLLLCALLAASPSAGVWLFRLLLFRFMFLSGVVKLLSGDPTWADASALSYHFETQPLPTALGWYAHHLPQSVLQAGVYATFVIELVLPFFVFLGRHARIVAACGFVLLEVLILLTGSYNFFNLLTIVLCFALADDRLLERIPRLRGVRGVHRGQRLTYAAAFLIGVLGLLVVLVSVTDWRGPRDMLAAVAPARAVNSYGLFAVMTTQRIELVVEGAGEDGRWRAYEFPYKPGNVQTRPGLATPHQPRLDWQMWFAALTSVERAPWTYGLADALLRAEPSVLALIDDPFAGAAPSKVRIAAYLYRYSSPDERRDTGAWWTRERLGIWAPEMRMRRPVIRHEPLTLE